MGLLVGKGVAHVAVTDSDKKGSQWLRLQQALGSSGEAQEKRADMETSKQASIGDGLTTWGSIWLWLCTGRSYSIALGSLAL